MVESNSNNQASHKLKSPFKAYNGDDEPYIFVSYKHKDADIVYPIIKQFHDRGFNIWYDEGLPYGENFDIVIPNKIEGAALFLNFITHECMAHANNSEDYMIKESDIAQYLEVPILVIYPQPDVKLKGYYLTNYLKKQSIYKHEYGSNEEMFIDVCVNVFIDKGLKPKPVEETSSSVEPSDKIIPLNLNPLISYTGDEPYVFVSYAHEDFSKIISDLNYFNELGVNIFYNPGFGFDEDWKESFENRIFYSSLFVVFISPNSIEDDMVRAEIFLALKWEIPVLPIYIEKTELKYGLKLAMRYLQSIFRYELQEEQYVQLCKRDFAEHGFDI